MKRLLLVLLLTAIMFPGLSYAQEDFDVLPEEEVFNEPIDGAENIPADAYYRAEVLEIVEARELGTGGDAQLFQTLRIKITSGDLEDQEVIIPDVGGLTVNGGKGFGVGDKLIVNRTEINGDEAYFVVDTYRLPNLYLLGFLFVVIVLIFSRLRGVSSLLGLAFTVLVIVKFVAPQIMAGKSPVFITLVAAVIIAVVTLYLAHGLNRRTSIALISTFITLAISVILAVIFVGLGRLFGNGTEEAIYLQLGSSENVNLRGLLLSGIILGALGVLDDITTAQSATVEELKRANPGQSFKQLYAGASSVGREHISSLINTLFLAYAGVSLPLFLLFSQTQGAPIWVILNAEFIAEEVVRTLIGSIALILAVPITTLLAAYYFDKHGASGPPRAGHSH